MFRAGLEPTERQVDAGFGHSRAFRNGVLPGALRVLAHDDEAPVRECERLLHGVIVLAAHDEVARGAERDTCDGGRRAQLGFVIAVP